MATLVRLDPFREMLDIRRRMDRLFDEGLHSMDQWEGDGSESNLALDVKENENQYTIEASIPGISPEDLDITMNNDVLTISGESKSESESEKGQWHLRERRFGRFSRSLRLPAAVNRDQIEATCENGVLTLQLPKAEETKPRRISIRGSNGNGQTIDGESQPTQAQGANI